MARAETAVARGEARSVSAYIDAMAGSGEARTTVAETIAQWRAEYGEPTAEQLAAAQDRAAAFFARTDQRFNTGAHGAA
jgi:hypothetical protein